MRKAQFDIVKEDDQRMMSIYRYCLIVQYTVLDFIINQDAGVPKTWETGGICPLCLLALGAVGQWGRCVSFFETD